MTATVIKAAAGLGKTSMLLGLLKDSAYDKVEIYVPTHDLGQHIAESLGKAIRHVVIKGRSYPNGNDRMCARHVEAELLVEKGYPVYPVLCAKRVEHGKIEHCEHYEKCAYIAQFNVGERVYIYTHASLPLERGVLEEGVPGLAVIDESFFNSCLHIFDVPIAAVMGTPHGSKTEAVLSTLLDILKSRKPLLAEMRARVQGAALKQALEENQPTLPHFSPYWNDKKQATAVKKLAPRPRLREMLETLQVELATKRPDSHAFTLNPEPAAIRIHRRLPITRFGVGQGGSAVLILDADADPLIVRQWFPTALIETIQARRNAYVFQCTSTRCSTISLVPDPKRHKDPKARADAQIKLDELQTLIDRKGTSGKKLLVVGPQAVTGNPAQDVAPLLTVPVGSELAHFGAIRGVDRWKDFDVAILVGRNQPAIAGAEAVARAIWFDDPVPLSFADDWQVEKRPYRVRSGASPLGIEVLVHPDPRVQAVVEQIRERESTQALDRLRLVHSPLPKEVFILSNVPIDIEIDAFRSWDEIVYGTRLERAWATLDGVMPLSPAWLARRFPTLWKSEAAAEADVRGLAKNREFTNKVSIRNSTVLTVHFRARDQKKHSWALSILPLGNTQVELTKLLEGQPLLVAEVVDGIRLLEGSSAVGDVTLPPYGASGQA